jgi:hypothetical protein
MEELRLQYDELSKENAGREMTVMEFRDLQTKLNHVICQMIKLQGHGGTCPECKDEYMGFGYDAHPLHQSHVCDRCYMNTVIPARFAKLYSKNS